MIVLGRKDDIIAWYIKRHDELLKQIHRLEADLYWEQNKYKLMWRSVLDWLAGLWRSKTS